MPLGCCWPSESWEVSRLGLLPAHQTCGGCLLGRAYAPLQAANNPQAIFLRSKAQR